MNRAHSPAFSDFVGVPYLDHGRTPAGWDCYGLVHYVSAAVLHRLIPSYVTAYASAEKGDAVADAITYHVREWHQVERDLVEMGDVLVFNIGGMPIHCGLAIDPQSMLHCLAGHETVVERFNGPRWDRRIAGVFRWQ